jgi:hypothetical protein
MEVMGVKITADTAQRMISEVDDNADQQIDMGEQYRILMIMRTQHNIFAPLLSLFF